MDISSYLVPRGQALLDSTLKGQTMPWFMYDLTNRQIVFNLRARPEHIQDTKQIKYTEVPVYGQADPPLVYSGGGLRRLSFNIKFFSNSPIGHIPLLAQIRAMRHGNLNRTSVNKGVRVIYFWGTGSVPLVWHVAKADIVHDGAATRVGMPYWSEVAFELIVDTTHPLYKIEQQTQRFGTSTVGQILGALG